MGIYKFDKENHVHSLDGKALMGTSTVVGVLAKPLTWWAAGLAVTELGWVKAVKITDRPKPTVEAIEENRILRLNSARFAKLAISLLTDEDYLKLLDQAYRAHADNLTKTADKGIDRHAALETYIKWCIREHDGIPKEALFTDSVEIFYAWAKGNIKRFLVSEGYCYSERLWTGGVCDLLFEDFQGRLGIMDFKSSKEAYLSQFFQIAGYDIAASENGFFDADGNRIYKFCGPAGYYGVLPFRMMHPEPQFHHDTKSARSGFEAAVTLHKIVNEEG